MLAVPTAHREKNRVPRIMFHALRILLLGHPPRTRGLRSAGSFGIFPSLVLNSLPFIIGALVRVVTIHMWQGSPQSFMCYLRCSLVATFFLLLYDSVLGALVRVVIKMWSLACLSGSIASDIVGCLSGHGKFTCSTPFLWTPTGAPP